MVSKNKLIVAECYYIRFELFDNLEFVAAASYDSFAYIWKVLYDFESFSLAVVGFVSFDSFHCVVLCNDDYKLIAKFSCLFEVAFVSCVKIIKCAECENFHVELGCSW